MDARTASVLVVLLSVRRKFVRLRRAQLVTRQLSYQESAARHACLQIRLVKRD